jgi:uncharacterized repeat protein (TIGR03803 family)
MNSAQQSVRSRRRLALIFMMAVLVLATLPSASAQTERVIYRFTGGANGSTPFTGLVADPLGNFYGATFSGIFSTAYKLSPPAVLGQQWTETILHTFGSGGDGASEVSVMTFDSAGNLYGATTAGGANGLGTVFQLVPPATQGGTWTESVLYSFKGLSDGASPFGGVVFDKAGNLYGTTDGNFDNTYGTVYELSPPAVQGGAWTETVLYSFQGANDGCGPQGKLAFGSNGTLLGTAVQCGGTQNTCFFGCGTIFELIPPAIAGGKWTEKTIYRFQGNADGSEPQNGLVGDGKGNFYGATQAGGACNGGAQCGTVFKIAFTGGKWMESVIYTFTAGTDGDIPRGGVVIDKSGNLYGTANYGGDAICNCGTVFKVTPPSTTGGTWTESTLHAFTSVPDGQLPTSTLTFAKGSSLYGTTSFGGECKGNTSGCGAVFQVLP